MSQSPPVLFDELPTAGGLRMGVARLNAEKSLNSLTLEMIDLLSHRISAWAADDGVALIMLEGVGERAFCAGADLTRLYAACRAHHASPARDDIRANPYALDFFAREYRLDYAIHTYRKPILCWGHGVVMGGGMGLMIGASHRVVTEQVRIAMPEINIGLYADVAGSWFLGRAPGHTGLFLALTAAQIGAADALFVGLGNFHIEHARKGDVLERIRAHLWRGDEAADRQALSRILLAAAAPLPAPGPLRRHFDTINALCAHAEPRDLVRAVATLESDDDWLNRAAATLRAGSPTTALLSIELHRRLKIRSLAEVFRAELVASLACAARPDLAEGIRALLIDKDRQPKWRPPTIEEITPGWLDAYFTSPWTPAEHPLADL